MKHGCALFFLSRWVELSRLLILISINGTLISVGSRVAPKRKCVDAVFFSQLSSVNSIPKISDLNGCKYRYQFRKSKRSEVSLVRSERPRNVSGAAELDATIGI